MRVLIVDDNPRDRAEAKAALIKGSRRLYEFAEASSAEEALACCSQAPLPDCVVLDLGLPDAGELEVLQRLPRDGDKLIPQDADYPVFPLKPGESTDFGFCATRG